MASDGPRHRPPGGPTDRPARPAPGGPPGRADAELLTGVAPPPHPAWTALAAGSPWRDHAGDPGAIAELVAHLEALGLVADVEGDGVRGNARIPLDRYPGGRGLAQATPAEAVRLITAYVQGDRESPGTLAAGLRDGSIDAALARIRSRRP